MRKWTEVTIRESSGYTMNTIIVFDARAAVIRRHYPSHDDQRRQGAQYYVNVVPEASWGHLARILYWNKENTAMEAFKALLPKPKGNQCDCVECVGAVCSDSVHSAL